MLSKGNRDQGDAEREGKGKEQWGAGKGSLEGGAERGSGGRRGGRGNGEPEGQNVARAERAAAGGAQGRGLISFTNGCEMRLAPLEAVRV